MDGRDMMMDEVARGVSDLSLIGMIGVGPETSAVAIGAVTGDAPVPDPLDPLDESFLESLGDAVSGAAAGLGDALGAIFEDMG